MTKPTRVTRLTNVLVLVALNLTWIASVPAAGPACVRVDGNDGEAIQAAIDKAAPGDVVCLEAGQTYTLSKRLTLRNGVSLTGRGADGKGKRAMLDASAADTLLLIRVVREGLLADPFSQVRIGGIDFNNVGFYFAGLEVRMDVHDVELVDNVFRGGKIDRTSVIQDPEYNSFYVRARYMYGLTIRDNWFLRTADTHGRGVQLYAVHYGKVVDNHFGCSTSACADVDRYGHFKTTVNILGYDGNAPIDTGCDDFTVQPGRSFCIDISRNAMMRNPKIQSSGRLEDHGTYAYAVKFLNLADNRISGWSRTQFGGSLVVRNAECVNIIGNDMTRSGITLFTRGPSKGNPVPDGPLHLLHVVVRNNTVTTGEQNADFYSGITYWRQYPFGTEYDIVIENNQIDNGRWGWYTEKRADAPLANRFGALGSKKAGAGPGHIQRQPKNAPAFPVSGCDR